MTVWLDGNAGAEYEEVDKMQPLFDLMKYVNLQDEMPYQEKGVSKVSLRLEKYDCGSIYFESNNNGEIWHYVGVSGDYL